MRKTVKGSRPRRVTDTQIAALGGRLTDRDRLLALDCYEHQVLTTEQLQRLWFPSVRAARYRLQALYSLRVLDHFRPVLKRGEGSAPYHWILDEAGAYVVAAEQGIERREVRWRHSRALTVAASPTLAHRVETNEFFTRLAQDARAAHGALSEWYGERTTHTMLDGIAKPDGYGVLTVPDRAPIHVLFELDHGTETIDRLLRRGPAHAQSHAAPYDTQTHSCCSPYRPLRAPKAPLLPSLTREHRSRSPCGLLKATRHPSRPCLPHRLK